MVVHYQGTTLYKTMLILPYGCQTSCVSIVYSVLHDAQLLRLRPTLRSLPVSAPLWCFKQVLRCRTARLPCQVSSCIIHPASNLWQTKGSVLSLGPAPCHPPLILTTHPTIIGHNVLPQYTTCKWAGAPAPWEVYRRAAPRPDCQVGKYLSFDCG